MRRNYPFSSSDLDFLTDKACIFLLEQFCQIYKNHRSSIGDTTAPPPKKRRIKKNPTQAKYNLSVLGKLDPRSLPTGYSTEIPPSPSGCDHCCKALNTGDSGTVLICGHGYHENCYNEMERKCRICLEHFKREIWNNVNQFLKRLNGGWDTLTSEDLNEDEQTKEDDSTAEDEETVDDLKMDKRQNLTLALNRKLNEIETW
jgi:hypothetical protein